MNTLGMDTLRIGLGLGISFTLVCCSIVALFPRQFNGAYWVMRFTGAKSQHAVEDYMRTPNRLILGSATLTLITLFVAQIVALSHTL